MTRFELFNQVEAYGGIYDTRKYRYYIRYSVQQNEYTAELIRMEKINLDTTYSLDSNNWEVVYTVVRK